MQRSYKYLQKGIFENERVLKFMVAMKHIGEQLFLSLRVYARNKAGQTGFEDIFRHGLENISALNKGVLEQELVEIKNEEPDIENDYVYVLDHYLACLSLFPDGVTHDELDPSPSFRAFLHAFYIACAQSQEMRSLQFFNLWGYDKEVFFMAAVRCALHQCTKIGLANLRRRKTTRDTHHKKKRHLETELDHLFENYQISKVSKQETPEKVAESPKQPVAASPFTLLLEEDTRKPSTPHNRAHESPAMQIPLEICVDTPTRRNTRRPSEPATIQ